MERNPFEVLGLPFDLISLIGDQKLLIDVAENLRKVYAKFTHPDLNPEGQEFLREVNVAIDALKNSRPSVFNEYRRSYLLRTTDQRSGNLNQERILRLQEELGAAYGRIQAIKNQFVEVKQVADRSEKLVIDWFREYFFWERVGKFDHGGLHILEIARLETPVILCFHWPVICPSHGRDKYLAENSMIANQFNFRFGVLASSGQVVTIPNFGEPAVEDSYSTWRDFYDKKHRALVRAAKTLKNGEPIANVGNIRSVEYVIGGMAVKDWSQPREDEWFLLEKDRDYSNSIVENDNQKIEARLSPLKPYLGIGMLVITRGNSWFHHPKGNQPQQGLECIISERGLLEKIISVDDLIDGLKDLVQASEQKKRKVRTLYQRQQPRNEA